MNKHTPTWQVNILTLFPEMFPGPLDFSIIGKARIENKYKLKTYNIRDFSENKHQTTDDRIFGGGPGMVMMPNAIAMAIDHINNINKVSKIIYFSPRGKVYNQEYANNLIAEQNIIMVCGRYEGIDQRVIDEYNMEEISIGDYILSGGEIAAITVIDSCVRLIEGVIKNNQANKEESFTTTESEFKNLLEYPIYTRPSKWRGRAVPDVLLSGNHNAIKDWRLQQSKNLTKKRRPDLWKQYNDK